MIQGHELLRSVDAQYARYETRNISRHIGENEEPEPKQKQHPVVDLSGVESKV